MSAYTAERATREKARRGTIDPREASQLIWGKKLEDWDDEELARGRPRNKSGNFTGPAPAWLNEQIQEEVLKRFRKRLREGLGAAALGAVPVLTKIMSDDRQIEDEDGNVKGFVVNPGTRADIAKWLLEEIIGKATTPIDVSGEIKFMGLMANVVVNADGSNSQGGTGEEYVGEAEEVEPEEDEDDD